MGGPLEAQFEAEALGAEPPLKPTLPGATISLVCWAVVEATRSPSAAHSMAVTRRLAALRILVDPVNGHLVNGHLGAVNENLGANRAHRRGGDVQRTTRADLHTRVQSKIHSLANLAAARATCRLAAAARRSQARRGAQPTQDAGLHPWPRLCPAHGRLAARVRGRRAVADEGEKNGRLCPGRHTVFRKFSGRVTPQWLREVEIW